MRIRLAVTDELQLPARRWGYMAAGEFRPLPLQPLLLAGLGPPPFDVTLPSGEIRHVVEEPQNAEETPHVR